MRDAKNAAAPPRIKPKTSWFRISEEILNPSRAKSPIDAEMKMKKPNIIRAKAVKRNGRSILFLNFFMFYIALPIVHY